MSTDFQPISVQIKQAYQHITSAQLNLKQIVATDSSSAIDPSGSNLPVSGAAISVKAQLDFDELVLFDGYVVKHKYKNSTGGTRLQVTAKNKSVKMAITRQTEVYAKQTDKDIIDTIVSSNGCSMETKNITTEFMLKHTQLVKNTLSDWDFINVRAEANGCFIYTHKDIVTIEKPIKAIDPTAVIAAKYGQNVFELEMEQDERQYQIENELIGFDLTSFESEITKEEGALPTGKSSIKGKDSEINYRTFNDRESTNLLNAETQLKALSKQKWVGAHEGGTYCEARGYHRNFRV